MGVVLETTCVARRHGDNYTMKTHVINPRCRSTVIYCNKIALEIMNGLGFPCSFDRSNLLQKASSPRRSVGGEELDGSSDEEREEGLEDVVG